MKQRWIATLIIICLVIMAAGCSSGQETEVTSPVQNEQKEETPEEAAQQAKQAKLELISPSAYGNIDGLELEPGTYFSVIGKGTTEEYWSAVKAGAEAAVEDLNEALGYEGADKIRMVYSGPKASNNVDEQVNILDEELARYPSALGIAVIDSQSCTVQFDLAVQDGRPIVTFDSASTYQGIMANVMTDNKAAATEAAVHMAELLEEKGQVLVIGHDSKSITSVERAESFAEEIQNNHPDMSVTEIYFMDKLDEWKEELLKERSGASAEENAAVSPASSSDEIMPEGLQEISDEEVYDYIFEKNPDIRGIYGTDGRAVMNMTELCERQEKDDIVIIGYDADSDEVEALKDGQVAGLVVQNPYGMGYAVIVAEARCILELGNEAEINSGYTWVTADNLEDKEIQRILYR